MSGPQITPGFAAVSVLALVALGALAGPITADQQVPDERPLVEVEVNGTKYSAPVFEDIKMSEARRRHDSESIGKIMKKMHDLVEMIVVKRKNPVSVGASAMGMISIAKESQARLKKLRKVDNSPELANGYSKKMGDLMGDILSAKSDEDIDAAEVKHRADNLIEAIQKLADTSPTGLYLDWTKFKVGEQSLSEYSAPLVRWFRKNGYGAIIKIFNMLATIVKALSHKKT